MKNDGVFHELMLKWTFWVYYTPAENALQPIKKAEKEDVERFLLCSAGRCPALLMYGFFSPLEAKH